MRLSAREIDTIKSAVRRHFGDAAHVVLFGSRADDDKRGGDIDLLIETSRSGRQAERAKIAAMSDMQLALGDQKIDIVLTDPRAPDGREIVEEARRHGVVL